MRQRNITDKAGIASARKTKRAARNRPIKAASWTDKMTAWALVAAVAVAIIGSLIALFQLQSLRNDTQARTRPYLVVQELQFYKVSSDSIYLYIDVTNSGERPATNISIPNIEVCVVSGNSCTPLYEGGSSDNNTILYPGRINTTKIPVNENDYNNISPTDTILVSIEYSYGNSGDKDYKKYVYGAKLRTRPSTSAWSPTGSDVWHIESETGN
jgi:hypothetical protein